MFDTWCKVVGTAHAGKHESLGDFRELCAARHDEMIAAFATENSVGHVSARTRRATGTTCGGQTSYQGITGRDFYTGKCCRCGPEVWDEDSDSGIVCIRAVAYDGNKPTTDPETGVRLYLNRSGLDTPGFVCHHGRCSTAYGEHCAIMETCDETFCAHGGWGPYSTGCKYEVQPHGRTSDKTGHGIIYSDLRTCTNPEPAGGGRWCGFPNHTKYTDDYRVGDCPTCKYTCHNGYYLTGSCNKVTKQERTCTICPVGYACHGGTAGKRKCNCLGGASHSHAGYSDVTGLHSCKIVPWGNYGTPIGSDIISTYAKCQPGWACWGDGQRHICGQGYFQPNVAQRWCGYVSCGYYCTDYMDGPRATGSADNLVGTGPYGKLNNGCIARAKCGFTHYCPCNGKRIRIKEGYYGNKGDTSRAQIPCEKGYRCTGGLRYPCFNRHLSFVVGDVPASDHLKESGVVAGPHDEFNVYNKQPISSRAVCEKCKICPEGQYQTHPCTLHNDTKCAKCIECGKEGTEWAGMIRLKRPPTCYRIWDAICVEAAPLDICLKGCDLSYAADDPEGTRNCYGTLRYPCISSWDAVRGGSYVDPGWSSFSKSLNETLEAYNLTSFVKREGWDRTEVSTRHGVGYGVANAAGKARRKQGTPYYIDYIVTNPNPQFKTGYALREVWVLDAVKPEITLKGGGESCPIGTPSDVECYEAGGEPCAHSPLFVCPKMWGIDVSNPGDKGKLYGMVGTDNLDGMITGNIEVDFDGIDMTLPVSNYTIYEVTYNLEDEAKNRAQQQTRKVKLIDSTPPIITILGHPHNAFVVGEAYDALDEVRIGDGYRDTGAIATDLLDHYTTTIVVECKLQGGTVTKEAGPVDSKCGELINTEVAGTYYIVYTATDAAGNVAQPKVRRVDVLPASPQPTTITTEITSTTTIRTSVTTASATTMTTQTISITTTTTTTVMPTATTTTTTSTTTVSTVAATSSDTGTIVGGAVGGLAIIALVVLVYILKSKKVMVVERDRKLPSIPKSEHVTQNNTLCDRGFGGKAVKCDPGDKEQPTESDFGLSLAVLERHTAASIENENGAYLNTYLDTAGDAMMKIYEEPDPIQPIVYDTKKLERERRANNVSETSFHVESDGYLNVSGEDPGVSSI